jgi:PAS domain-containing protein
MAVAWFTTSLKEPMKSPILGRFPYTAVALILALLVLVASVFWNIDIFALPGLSIVGIEQSEIGEVVIAFLLVIPAFFVDRVMDRLHQTDSERTRFALAAAHVGVWEWNIKSDQVRLSDATALAFGLNPADAPKSRAAFFALVHPEDQQALGQCVDRAIRDHTDLVTQFRTVSADDVVRWSQTMGRVTYGTDGTASRLLGVSIDISHLKLVEEQLLEAQRQTDRLMVLKATMRTVQDIVGNALMSLYLFRAEAEPNVSPAALAQFDHIVEDTAGRLKAIADLERVVEISMAAGPGVDYREPSTI